MIGELLEKIKDAEFRAAEIITAAREQAGQIESAAQKEIDKIERNTEEAIARAMHKSYHKSPAVDAAPPQKKELVVAEEQIKAAKKYILDEFKRRYPA